MSESPATSLLTCPDCGGILEPTRPAWAATIDYAVSAEPTAAESAQWNCLLCGYRADVPGGPNRPPSDS